MYVYTYIYIYPWIDRSSMLLWEGFLLTSNSSVSLSITNQVGYLDVNWTGRPQASRDSPSLGTPGRSGWRSWERTVKKMYDIYPSEQNCVNTFRETCFINWSLIAWRRVGSSSSWTSSSRGAFWRTQSGGWESCTHESRRLQYDMTSFNSMLCYHSWVKYQARSSSSNASSMGTVSMLSGFFGSAWTFPSLANPQYYQVLQRL